VLGKRTALSADIRKAIVASWTEQQKNTKVAESPAATDGKDAWSGSSGDVRLASYAGLDWRIGLSVTSSAVHNLKQPFVQLSLHVTGDDGIRRSHPLELSLKQFQDFARTINDLGVQAETL